MTRHDSVGVEIELTGLSAPEVAEVVVEAVGGRIDAASEHLLTVADTILGEFEIKLDTRFADEAVDASPAMRDLADGALSLAEAVLPIEITAPPVPVENLGRLDALLRDLAARGGRGTRSSPAAAYAVHLNPSIDRFDAASLQAWMQAFALGFAWLEHVVDANWTRRAIGFAKPYPEAYVRTLCTVDYTADRDRLIDDYLAANPTRDRALDMLPVFAHVDPERVRRALPKEPVSARPTLHYRLPDCRIGEPDWSLLKEWGRWSNVSELAADTARRDGLRRRFVEASVSSRSDEWREISQSCLEASLVR